MTLEETLNDLLMARERINAELAAEIYRHERLRDAVARLAQLNALAEQAVSATMERLQHPVVQHVQPRQVRAV